MADHKREQIIDALVTALGALVSATVDKVERGRDAPFASSINKAITIYQGSDEPQDSDGWHVIHSVLTVNIDIHVRSSSAQIDEEINSIRKAITTTLWGDYTLGLSFVSDMDEGPAVEPEISGEGKNVTAIARNTWTFKYSRNRIDPSI